MSTSFRVFYRNRQGYGRAKFEWRQNDNWSRSPFTKNSVVYISITEARFAPDPGSFIIPPIDRWAGAAAMTIHNVSPYDGGVEFTYTIDYDNPLDFAVDITIMGEPAVVWDGDGNNSIMPNGRGY